MRKSKVLAATLLKLTLPWTGLGAIVPVPLVATWQASGDALWRLNATLAALFWPGGSILYAITVLDPSGALGQSRWRWDFLAQLCLLNGVVYGFWALTLVLARARNEWWAAAAIVPGLFAAATAVHLSGIMHSF